MFAMAVKQKTGQLAFDYGETGEALSVRVEGRKAIAAHSGVRTLAQSLLEAVVEPCNMRLAVDRVKANKGSAGVDGMSVDELSAYISCAEVAVAIRGDHTANHQTQSGSQCPPRSSVS